MKKKIIISLVVIILVLGLLCGGFALLWFKTDVLDFMKPAKAVWNKQVEKALGLEDVKFADYSDALKDYKEIKDKSFKSKFEVTANLDLSELDSDTKKIINNSKLTIETNADVPNEKTQNKIGIYGNDTEILTLDTVTDGTTIGIGCSDLYDKYITISAEDLVDYIKENMSSNSKTKSSSDKSLELMASALTNSSKIDLYELAYISNDDLKHFDKTYRNALETMIPKKCYSKESGVTVSVDGKDEKTNAYYLTMNGEDAYEFAKNLTDTIQDDEVLAELIANKANLLIQSSGLENELQSTLGVKKLNKGQVTLILNMLCSSLMEEIEPIKQYDDQGIKIAVYTKNNKLVKIEVIVFDKDDEMTIATAEYAKSKNIYTIYQSKDTELISIVDEYTKKTDEEKAGKLTLKVSGKEMATADYEIVDKKDKSKIYFSADIPDYKANFKIDISSKGNYKKEPVEIEGKISFKYGRESAEVKFNGSIEFTDNVSVPTLNSSNSFNILKATEKEINKEFADVAEKAEKLLVERVNKAYGLNLNSNNVTNVPTTTTTKTTNLTTPNITIPSNTTTSLDTNSFDITSLFED